MLTSSCHCGAVQLEVPNKPRQLTSCNCSICRRYGTLWAYYSASSLKLRGATDTYSWGEKSIEFVRCKKCGCVMQWRDRRAKKESRAGVNARNFDPADISKIRIRRLDGASSWKFLD